MSGLLAASIGLTPMPREPPPRWLLRNCSICAVAAPRRHPRPRGRQLDAVGRDHRPVARAVVRRRLADDLAERAAEGAQAVEADVEADVGDAAVGLAQQEHRALDPPPLQVAVRRLPEDGAEAAAEVRLGDVGHRGDGANVERLGVGAVHGVAGAQQAPVQVLGFPAHRATLRTRGRVLTAPRSSATDSPTRTALPRRSPAPARRPKCRCRPAGFDAT